MAIEKVIFQVELLSHTDKVSTFFDAIDSMLDQKTILYGREFRIEKYEERIINLEEGDKAIKYGTRLLYLCVRNVHDLYKKFKASDEPMSRQTLLTYLKAHPAYVGVKKGVRFTWKEPEYVARTDSMGVEQEGAVMSMKQETKISRCHVFDYDHLVAMMHIDLLRDKPTDAPVNMEEKPF